MPNLIRNLPFLDTLLWRRSRRRSGDCRAVPNKRLQDELPADLPERRGEAMRRLFPKLHYWRPTVFDRSAALHAYSYLSEAASVDDLERRIHQLERKRHFRH